MSRAEMVSSNRCMVPPDLASARGKLVYLYLSTREVADLEEIAEDLALPLLTVCDLLETLEERGLVIREADRYRCAN